MQVSDVKRFAVIGLGKMGVDWIANLVEGGYEVVGFDTVPEARDRAPKSLAKALGWVAKKRHPEEEGFAEQAAGRLTVVGSEEELISQLGSCQVLLEVILEDLGLKCEVLSRLAPHLPDAAMIWTNTSSLSVHTMGVAAGRPDRFVGTHGMNPVYQMPAVEVVRHSDIADSTLGMTLEILRGLGKDPFVASDVTGFWVNKHLVPFMLEAYRALERGEITVEDGDRGLKGSLGHPQGVFKLSDFIGNDTMYRVAMAMYLATQDPRYYPPAILARMFKNGEFGVKAGKGFYEWDGFKATGGRDFSALTIKCSDTLLEV
ncbi:MAG: 3-hydroxyacyl-CoA dehydrogenase family protein [Acidobacteria bacterium]|jgi:3-hydroxyacyl-CoA dehydrogenase|nr:3-hydroxyacyl-CoA dehydrogenase family protein [Acidobacteriota bacterium]